MYCTSIKSFFTSHPLRERHKSQAWKKKSRCPEILDHCFVGTVLFQVHLCLPRNCHLLWDTWGQLENTMVVAAPSVRFMGLENPTPLLPPGIPAQTFCSSRHSPITQSSTSLPAQPRDRRHSPVEHNWVYREIQSVHPHLNPSSPDPFEKIKQKALERERLHYWITFESTSL